MSLDPRIVKKTVGEMGNTLPIGVLGDDGKFHRSFSLGPLDFKKERALGKFRKANMDKPSSVFISKILALLLNEIGGKTFSHDIDDDEKAEAAGLLEVGKLFLADVYYIFLRARMEEIGDEYPIKFLCEYCGHEEIFDVDMKTMNVLKVEDHSVLSSEVELVKGITYRDGSVRHKVRISPMLWLNMVGKDTMEIGQDPLLVKLHFISKCIVGIEGVESNVILTESEVNSLRKIDIEKVFNAISDIDIGPTMILEGKCPDRYCMNNFVHEIDLRYDSFFSTASPSSNSSQF